MATNEQKKKKVGGAPKGNRNAAKPGEDLRIEFYLSKVRRQLLIEWFELRFGFSPNEEQLSEALRQILNTALNHEMVEEFEKHRPGSTKGGYGEVF
jgi:hypothetical protein